MRKAFTIIELMVVIGILLVLIGLVAIGLSQIGENQKAKNTQHMLESLASMHEELKSKTNLRDIPTILEAPGMAAEVRRFDAPTPDQVFNHPALIRTSKLMQRLLSIPLNKTTMQQLPADRFLTTVPSGVTVANELKDKSDPSKFATPLPVDAWGTSILYIPPPNVSSGSTVNWDLRYGLKVWLHPDKNGAPVEHIVLNPRQGYPKGNDFVMLQTFRPFWASAGPDGDFAKGDDNIYSFEN